MMAKKRISLSELTVQDVICPICLSILIEPVSMPCSHSLCMPCFKQHVAETSLACPVCRLRISIWVRRTTKTNRLINVRLWQMIKEKFAAKVEARLQGVEESDENDFMIPEPRVCAPGEIRQEYEAQIEREQKEMASRRSQEEEASTKLILQMQEEEKMKLRHRQAQEEDLCRDDEVLAQQIREAENLVLEQKLKDIQLLCGSDEEIARRIEIEEKKKSKPVPKAAETTPTRGPMDIYLGQKTPRSKGKLLIPDMKPQPSASATPFVITKSSKLSGTECSSSKVTLEYRTTPTSSAMSYKIYNHTDGNRSDLTTSSSGGVPHSNSGSSNDSNESKIGRQLREITSSQSSESESEELILAAHIDKKRRIQGKENKRSSGNASPNKSRSCSPNKPERKSGPSKSGRKKKSLVYKHNLNTSRLSEAEDMTPEMITSVLMEDSGDETDIEDEDTEYVAYMKGKEKSDNCVSKTHMTREAASCNRKDRSHLVMESEPEEDNDNNSSMDYDLIFSNEEEFANSLERMREEQRKIEEQLRQEENDRLFAQSLQNQMYQELIKVDRTRGSKDEYSLRNRKPVAGPSKALPNSPSSSSSKRERQTTLVETLTKRFKKS